MRNRRPRAAPVPPRLGCLLYLLVGLLFVGYVIHTEMYRVYLVNYRSNEQIGSLRGQLERERARSAELEWEKETLLGPDGPARAALRQGWGRPGQVRIKTKVLRPEERRDEGAFRRLADRIRDFLLGGRPPPSYEQALLR